MSPFRYIRRLAEAPPPAPHRLLDRGPDLGTVDRNEVTDGADRATVPSAIGLFGTTTAAR